VVVVMSESQLGTGATWQLTSPGPTPLDEPDVTTLPEGVLDKAGPAMSVAIGVIAIAAMGEAGWNLGTFVHDILHLPMVLAALFPVIAEVTASSFAVQDLRDRRQGVRSTGLRTATYLTLGISAVVNGIVGAAMYGPGGVLEVFAPVALGVVIHLHGDRATRAHQSRARQSPAWRQEQLRTARLESVVEVLPLLVGDDEDGRATLVTLRRRLLSHTLSPEDALVAAGWHQRAARGMGPSQLRRLETVAATVWGPAKPPSPAPALRRVTTSPVRRSTSPSRRPPNTASTAPSLDVVTGRSTSATGLGAKTRRISDEDLADVVAQVRAQHPDAGEGSVRRVLKQLGRSASSHRIRAALARHS
jgi:hypothetical protein